MSTECVEPEGRLLRGRELGEFLRSGDRRYGSLIEDSVNYQISLNIC